MHFRATQTTRAAGTRVVAGIGVATMVALFTAACEKPAPTPPPPPEVYVTSVTQRDVPVYLELVGQAEGYQDLEIRARVEGFIESVNFQEGTFVRKGDVLYEIDRKPFEAAVAEAKADLATSQAKLEKANNDVTRYRPLVAKQAVSQMELDNAVAAQDASRAETEAAKAALEQATINLGYTTIMSPINGLIGTTQMKAGSLVGRGESTLLTTISQIDPITIRVGVTEADFLRVSRRRQAGGGATDAAGPRDLDIGLTLADGTLYPQKGTLGPVERAVDPTTGTIAVEFDFPNAANLIRPGQYGRVRLTLETKAGALLVPQRAVQELQNLYSVGVVGADNKVAFRNVKVGLKVDSLWVIEEGLKPGEQVIVEGLQRVQDGMTVTAKPAPAAKAGAVEAK